MGLPKQFFLVLMAHEKCVPGLKRLSDLEPGYAHLGKNKNKINTMRIQMSIQKDDCTRCSVRLCPMWSAITAIGGEGNSLPSSTKSEAMWYYCILATHKFKVS